MDAVKYWDVLKKYKLPHAQEKMAVEWVFQQDNDPKHTDLARGQRHHHPAVTVAKPGLLSSRAIMERGRQAQ